MHLLQEKFNEMFTQEEIKGETLEELAKLLNNLEEKKILKFLNSFLEKSDEMLEVILTWMNRPENTNMIKNFFLIFGFLKNVEFEKLNKIAKALAHGINKAYDELGKEKKIGIIGILRAINDPDINRSIRVILAILKGMGEELKD
jgi:uncharacterized protein YjgD (DUF1641 family)